MKTKNAESNPLQHEIDALVEFVHRGCAPMLDVNEVLRVISFALQPNSSMNYEYRFAWSDECDLDALKVDWKELKTLILRRAVRDSERSESILAGGEMTSGEKDAYRLELAREEYDYKTAEERLESNDNCKWVDLSYVTDSQGRQIYFIEMGDAIVGEDDDDDKLLDMVIDRMDEIWHWKRQPLDVSGPFRSVEEAEVWMGQKGAFQEAD